MGAAVPHLEPRVNDLYVDPHWIVFAIVAILVAAALYAVIQRIEHP